MPAFEEIDKKHRVIVPEDDRKSIGCAAFAAHPTSTRLFASASTVPEKSTTCTDEMSHKDDLVMTGALGTCVFLSKVRIILRRTG